MLTSFQRKRGYFLVIRTDFPIVGDLTAVQSAVVNSQSEIFEALCFVRNRHMFKKGLFLNALLVFTHV